MTELCDFTIVYLENAWAIFSMITEGEAAILLETTQRAFRNQSQSKQRSTIAICGLDMVSNVVILMDTIPVYYKFERNSCSQLNNWRVPKP